MKIIERLGLKPNERIVGLDILRTIAILEVVYGHGVLLLQQKHREFYLDLELLRMDGVSIFFVLSGFLIGGILLKIINRTEFTPRDLLNFWVRRWFRTIPNYLLVMLAIVAYRLLISFNLQGFGWEYIFFFQSFASPHPEFFPEAWSLAIEEWFYLLFPVSCFVLHKLLKHKTQSILISALIFISFPLVLRIMRFEQGGINLDFDSEIRKVTLLRLDSLMYGILGAYIYYKLPDFWFKTRFYFLAIGAAMLFFFLLAPNFKSYYPPISFNLESIATLFFIPYLSTVRTTNWKALDSGVIFISIISYSMYLLNLTPVIVHGIPLINDLLSRANITLPYPNIVNYIAYWAITIVGSYLLYRYFEAPMTQLRERVKL